MKALPFIIPKPEAGVLVYQEDHEEIFYDQLHQHEEIQISWIVEGTGSLIIGDSVSTYKKGDILVIGENIPHVFRSDVGASAHSVMYTLFFTQTAFGPDFFDIPELRPAKRLFKEAEYGVKMLSHQQQVFQHFTSIRDKRKFERIASFLNILDLLVQAEKVPLSSFVYRKKYTPDDGKRMSAVFEHLMNHFDEAISLEDIAEKANMSKNAFCRYFKKRTNKTFFQFLIELRIEKACKLLYRNPELSISSISMACGFQNIANFNRKFKEIKGTTPSRYRSQF